MVRFRGYYPSKPQYKPTHLILKLPKANPIDPNVVPEAQKPDFPWLQFEEKIDEVFKKSNIGIDDDDNDKGEEDKYYIDGETYREGLKIENDANKQIEQMIREEEMEMDLKFKFENINQTLDKIVTRALFELVDFSKIKNMSKMKKERIQKSHRGHKYLPKLENNQSQGFYTVYDYSKVDRTMRNSRPTKFSRGQSGAQKQLRGHQNKPSIAERAEKLKIDEFDDSKFQKGKASLNNLRIHFNPKNDPGKLSEHICDMERVLPMNKSLNSRKINSFRVTKSNKNFLKKNESSPKIQNNQQAKPYSRMMSYLSSTSNLLSQKDLGSIGRVGTFGAENDFLSPLLKNFESPKQINKYKERGPRLKNQLSSINNGFRSKASVTIEEMDLKARLSKKSKNDQKNQFANTYDKNENLMIEGHSRKGMAGSLKKDALTVFQNFQTYNKDLIQRAKLAIAEALSPELLKKLSIMDPTCIDEIKAKVEQRLSQFVRMQIYLGSDLIQMVEDGKLYSRIDKENTSDRVVILSNLKYRVKDLIIDPKKMY